MRLLLLISLAVFASPAFAQTPVPVGVRMQPIGYKDPTVATLLGVVITGGGQFYADEPGKGIFLLGTAIAGTVMAVTAAPSEGSGGVSGQRFFGLALAIGSWLAGWGTAAHDAQIHNDELLSSIGIKQP